MLHLYLEVQSTYSVSGDKILTLKTYGPPWFNYWFSFTLAYIRISHEYSSLFIIVINLIFFVFALTH